MSYDKSRTAKIKPQRKKPRKISESYLHNSGLYYLERFSASKEHFKNVMTRKVKRSCLEHSEQDYELYVNMVYELADKFERVGLLDDKVYTRAVVTSLRRKGMSRPAILNKMRIKGIPQEATMQALDVLDNEAHETVQDAEKAAALKLARKKRLGPYSRGEKEQEDQKYVRRALGVFARAGFSYEMAKSILDMSADDLDEFEPPFL